MTLIFGVSLVSTQTLPLPSRHKLAGMESYKRKGKSHFRLKTKYQSLDFSTRNYMYKVKISHATPYVTDPYLMP